VKLNSPGALVNALALALVYTLLAQFSYGVSSAPDQLPMIWLPASIAIVWVMGSHPRIQWLLYLAALAADLLVSALHHSSLALVVGGSAARLAGLGIAVFLLQGFYREQLTVRDSASVFAVYTIVAAPAAALLGASVLALYSDYQWSSALLNLWLGDVLGAVLLLLPAMVIRREGLRRWTRWRELPALGMQLLSLLLIGFLLLNYLAYPFAYLALPLMAIALMYGMVRVAVLANLVFLVLGSGIVFDFWDFPVLSSDENMRGLWAATVAVIFGPVMLGLAMDEIRSRQIELATLSERLNLAAQSVDLGLWDWDIPHQEIYWDHRMRQLYEISPYEEALTVEQWLPRLHPDDMVRAEQAIRGALERQENFKIQFRVRRRDGTYRSLQAAGIVICDQQGATTRLVGLNWDVTELVSAQRAVKTAEDRLTSIIEAAREFSIIAANRNGEIDVFSAGAERLLGYTRTDMLGKTPALFHDEEEVAEEGRRLSKKLGYEVTGFDVFVAEARGGSAVSREWTYIRKDGRRVPVNLTVTAVYDASGNITGYLGVARNISRQKAVENEIRATHSVLEQQIALAQQMRDEFESLFELAPGAMLVVDGEGYLVNANSRAHQMLGCDHTMLGRSITAYLPDFTHFQEPSPELRTEHKEEECLAVRTDGSRFEALLEYSPLLLNGVVHTIVNIYDISQQKEAERVLQRSRDLAESANRAKTEFLANMSHEIRTPLNAVLGAAQLLNYSALDARQVKHVGMILASGKALLALLNDVLDVSKIEAGKMELSRARFALDDVIEPLATIMSGTAAGKHLELVIDVDPALPLHLIGDAMRFQQVLVNLTGNAIKFTEQGVVAVRFRLLSLQQNRVEMSVDIRDSGIGMNQEQKARLFHAFAQADSSITRRFGGSGLGLTICRKLVQLMEGEISVRSEPGQGSEFSCRLVLELDTEADTSLAAARTPQRVLLADSCEESAHAMMSSFQRWGWSCRRVSAVGDVQLALEQEPCDVLIFNQSLDNGNVLDGMARTMPTVKLVGISHEELLSLRDSRNQLIQLSKPVTAAQLLDGIGEALAHFASERPVLPLAPTEKLPRLDGARLLLVEDTLSNQTIIIGILEQVGATVDVDTNGVQALARLARYQGEVPYDAVLMDVQMPEMDGFTATRKIREELGLDIPIIAMTAGVLAFERRQCIESGMNDFVGKPLDIPAMVATIARYVPTRAAATPVRTPAAAGSAAPATLPVQPGVFNPERILAFVRGRPEREWEIVKMIQQIVSNDTAPVQEGRALLAQNDLENARRHYHTIKGSLGNFGAERVMAAAQALETAIRAGRQSGFESLLNDFEGAYMATLAQAKAWLQRYQAETALKQVVGGTMDAEQFASALDRLRLKLGDSSMEAVDLFHELGPELVRRMGQARVTSITEAVEELRFSDAISLLDKSA